MHATLSLGLAAVLLSGHAQEPRGLDLRGEVIDADGEALGGATIFVYTAAPREGTSPL